MARNGRNIKLLIAYDGTDYSGWQRQDNGGITVQGVIEQALAKLHGEPVSLTGSGRTDAGVHAVGQSANFYTSIANIPADRFTGAINALLPQDIRIRKACEVAPDFHARFNACSRIYRYYFLCRPALPHESRYNLQLRRFPQLKTLNAYCRLLAGETDCTTFSGRGDVNISKSRYIYSACFFVEGERLVFEICANAFLRKMVRSIGGTFLHYEQQDVPPQKMREIIESGDRSLVGPTLPPHGLFLWKVEY